MRELANYVISRYSELDLGKETIIESLKAWSGEKIEEL